jgi:hypothetical protein
MPQFILIFNGSHAVYFARLTIHFPPRSFHLWFSIIISALMDKRSEEPTPDASKHNDVDSDTIDALGTPPTRIEDVEKIGASVAIDKETEKKLLRKLDVRIIPMICWIYLMNFMDRGEYSTFCSLYCTDCNSEYWECSALPPGTRPQHAGQPVSACCFAAVRHICCKLTSKPPKSLTDTCYRSSRPPRT